MCVCACVYACVYVCASVCMSQFTGIPIIQGLSVDKGLINLLYFPVDEQTCKSSRLNAKFTENM